MSRIKSTQIAIEFNHSHSDQAEHLSNREPPEKSPPAIIFPATSREVTAGDHCPTPRLVEQVRQEDKSLESENDSDLQL